MTPAELLEWVTERASAIVESGEDLYPVVWTLTEDGDPLGVFMTSRSGLRIKHLVEPAALVARALGTPYLVLVSEAYIRRYIGDIPEDLPPAAEDPEAADAIVAYEAGPETTSMRLREYHRDDRGAVSFDDWRTHSLSSGLIHDRLRSAVEAHYDLGRGTMAAQARALAHNLGLYVAVFEGAE